MYLVHYLTKVSQFKVTGMSQRHAGYLNNY